MKEILEELKWINEFNKELSLRYGPDAAIQITIYSNYKKLAKKHKFNIAEGTDLFESDGRLGHDFFLGMIRAIQDGIKINPIKYL